jgi:uncharacterized protein YqeY
MSTLSERITEEWKAAMRSGDTQRRDTMSVCARPSSAAKSTRVAASGLDGQR